MTDKKAIIPTNICKTNERQRNIAKTTIAGIKGTPASIATRPKPFNEEYFFRSLVCSLDI